MAIAAYRTPAPVVQPRALLRRATEVAPGLLRATVAQSAPLPPLTAAFSRRRAIFGAVAATGLLAASGVAAAAKGYATQHTRSALDPADARLVALADAYEALDLEVNATTSTAPGYTDLIDRHGPIEDELADTPAETMTGLLAKARVLQVSTCRDCAAADIGGSLADDLVRLFGGRADV